ncbi:glycosyltransferase family 2 protein [Dyadobacter subterraneus]|uniref:Glycosyltransferase n=1 Tax=Dyadobacter subterraneus TaxID=2773304 RepID=A0ABR9WFH0_9BACT|nr:glycosyltransferase [Dyadobacter subterraneus]MBE9464240.1 glycosyltransferase [Dyadobacter subterraneus]
MSVCISVVIPTYRRPHLLKKCLIALAKQNFPFSQFEILVVSDGPDEPTMNMINQFKELVEGLDLHFFFTPEKKGPAAARNFGWKKAKGELIAFTDDDCMPSADWLAGYLEAYSSQLNEQLVAFTGNVVVPVPDLPTDYEKNVANLETADFITANCACSRASLEEIKGFDEEFPIAWREDSALEFALMEHGIPILRIDTAEVVHPVREAPWGISLKEQKKSMFNALLFKKFPDLYKSKISAEPVWSYYAIILLSLISVIFLIAKQPLPALITFIIWFYFVVNFIHKRLKHTNLSVSHRMEMILTSLLIPYLSVYWTLRGAIRYKVFFL